MSRPSSEVVSAAQRGDLSRLRALISEDPAALVARDAQGVSALLQAVYHRHPEAAELFAERRPLDPFEAAALGKLLDLAALLDEDPSAARATSPDGFSALGLAAFFGRAEEAQLLLERGAEVNAPARNPSRVTPLHSAVAGGDAEIVRLLLERGADVEAEQHGGARPIHSAAASGRTDLLRLLLDAGARVDVRTQDGQTPLSLAEARGHRDAAELVRAAAVDHGG